MPTNQATRLQHPIPQNIMSVEFKLFGDLTIKQFVYLAFGGGLVFIGLSTRNLPLYLKGLLIIGGGLGGLSFAFLPLNDRGMDEWIVNFFKAIFSPTQRIYKKTPQVPALFLSDYAQFIRSEVIALTPAKTRHALLDYLSTVKEEPLSAPDKKESEFLQKLSYDISLPQGLAPIITAPPILPQEEVETSQDFPVFGGKEEMEKIPLLRTKISRALREIPLPQGEISLPMHKKADTPQKEMISPVNITQKTAELRELVAKIKASAKTTAKPEPPALKTEPPQPKPQPLTLPSIAHSAEEEKEKPLLQDTEKKRKEEEAKRELDRLAKEKNLLEQKLRVTEERLKEKEKPSTTPSFAEQERKRQGETLQSIQEKNTALQAEMEKTLLKLKEAEKLKEEEKRNLNDQLGKLQERLNSLGKEKESAQKDLEAARGEMLRLQKIQGRPISAFEAEKDQKKAKTPIKTTPSLSQGIPNIINGIVKSREGKVLEDALVVVKDENDEPVRALKTNALGQFVIATPVPNGEYSIHVSFAAENFDILKVIVVGEELSAVEVNGK